jgi:hypothetical protein
MLRWVKRKTGSLEWFSTQPLYTVYGMTLSLPRNMIFELGQFWDQIRSTKGRWLRVEYSEVAGYSYSVKILS